MGVNFTLTLIFFSDILLISSCTSLISLGTSVVKKTIFTSDIFPPESEPSVAELSLFELHADRTSKKQASIILNNFLFFCIQEPPFFNYMKPLSFLHKILTKQYKLCRSPPLIHWLYDHVP